MRIFLDSSVLIAASLSEEGGSHWITRRGAMVGWQLITAEYCITEVEKNLPRLSELEQLRWVQRVRPRIEAVETHLALDRPLVFSASKDRPVIISALAAHCDVLVTLDQHDFARWLGSEIYGLRIMRPAMLVELAREQKADRLNS